MWLRSPPLMNLGGEGRGFTQIPKKKNIKIINNDELVSFHLFSVNRVHHCSVGPTARGGPRLVRLINFFF